jgi:hypothetical protein
MNKEKQKNRKSIEELSKECWDKLLQESPIEAYKIIVKQNKNDFNKYSFLENIDSIDYNKKTAFYDQCPFCKCGASFCWSRDKASLIVLCSAREKIYKEKVYSSDYDLRKVTFVLSKEIYKHLTKKKKGRRPDSLTNQCIPFGSSLFKGVKND